MGDSSGVAMGMTLLVRWEKKKTRQVIDLFVQNEQ
jgi:hypothetical protein